jgi:23S rRNA pseudouridine1911/1915/1917 synthase
VSDASPILVAPEEDGERLDVVVAGRLPAVSRVDVQAAIKAQAVTVDHRVVRPSYRVAAGDRIRVEPGWLVPAASSRDALGLLPEAEDAAGDPDLKVLYLDDAVIVIDKAPGQVVHPAVGHPSGTLVSAVLARFPDVRGVEPGDRPGLVHRLDRDTSGVIVVARTASAAAELRRQFKARSVAKTYLAVVKGSMRPPEGVIDAPIARHPRQRQRMAAVPGGRDARTRYRVMAESPGYSLVEAHPETGRTHQIRVHFAAVGHPVAGDRVYGRRDAAFARTALHAWRLAFDHPETRRRVAFEAPLPDELRRALDEVGLRWPGD